MGDITPHFSRHEFGLPEAKAREYGFEAAEYPAEWAETRLRPLCDALELLRDKLGGKRVRVISGYRPKAYDMARIAAGRKGVSPNSQHHDGRAADLQIEGVEPAAVYAAVLALAEAGRVLVRTGVMPNLITIGGVGVYDEFVHVDIRPSEGPVKTWDERSR